MDFETLLVFVVILLVVGLILWGTAVVRRWWGTDRTPFARHGLNPQAQVRTGLPQEMGKPEARGIAGIGPELAGLVRLAREMGKPEAQGIARIGPEPAGLVCLAREMGKPEAQGIAGIGPELAGLARRPGRTTSWTWRR